MQELEINLPGGRAYPIRIGSGVLEQAAALVPGLDGRRVFILADEACRDYAARLEGSLGAESVKYVPGREKTKSWPVLQDVLDWLLGCKLDRKSVLFAVGGGVVGDLGGFAASIALRGIDFVQVPTTLLAQVDSSVGGKTGINAAAGKNLIGSFYQPIAVLCDTDVLGTLPDRQMRAGYAEGLKHGLIGDAELFGWLEENGAAVLARENGALTDFIARNCAFKARIVEADEKEAGRRALLNLGHTFGHALEAACAYDGRLLHGEAVAIGCVLALRLSVRMGLCPEGDLARVLAHMEAVGLPTTIRAIDPPPASSAEALYELMLGDKKASGGRIGFILAAGIGKAFQSRDVDPADVIAILHHDMET